MINDKQASMFGRIEEPVVPALLKHPIESMAGQFHDIASIRKYIEAGNAIVTIRSKVTTDRFTFKFVRPEEQPNRERPIWARLMMGSDNETNYSMMGTFWPNQDTGGAWHVRYAHYTKFLKVKEDANSVKAAKWLFYRVYVCESVPAPLFDQAEIWHEGCCGRCGRRLTVPESIASGFGPECVKMVNKDPF